MRRFERTWPTAVTAIAGGALAGWMATGSAIGLRSHQAVDPWSHPGAHELAVPAVESTPSFHSAKSSGDGRIALSVMATLDTEALLDVLRSGEHDVDRRNAAIALGASPEPSRVLPALMIALRSDASPAVRFMAAESLGRLERSASAGMLGVALAADDDLRVREAAAAALGAVGDPASVPALRAAALEDEADDVRVQAVRALLVIGDGTAFRAVEDVLRADPSPTVRRSVMDGMRARSARR